MEWPGIGLIPRKEKARNSSAKAPRSRISGFPTGNDGPEQRSKARGFPDGNVLSELIESLPGHDLVSAR